MQHLVFLVHGINGHSTDLEYFEKEFKSRLSDSSHIVKSTDSHTLKTNHGIDVCGALIAKEMKQIIREHNVTKLSCVGHSMGGLTLRYALGILNTDRVLENVELVSFITLATPHLSSIAWERMLWHIAPVAKSIGVPSLLMGPTGKQLFLQDVDDYNRIPLLERMASDPQFVLPLSKFKDRIVYGNIAYDVSVHFGTSMILRRHGDYDLDWKSLMVELVVIDSENDAKKEHGHEVVERMACSLQNLSWTRVGVKPMRWLTAHTDMVATNRQEAKVIFEDVWSRIKSHHV